MSNEKEEEKAPPVIIVPPAAAPDSAPEKPKKVKEEKPKAEKKAEKKKHEKAEKNTANHGEEDKESTYIPPSDLEVKPEPQPANSHYYYNQQPAPYAPPAQPAPKKKRRQNFFLKFLSFILALILSVALILALPITLLRFLLTDHNIEVIVDRAVSSIELSELEFATASGNKKLSGVLLEVTDQFEGWNHITEDQINDALLEDFVRDFVTDALKQYGMSLKDGEQMLGWTPEQIYDFVAANKDTIEKLARDAGYTGKLPIEEKKDMMIENIEKHIGEDGITVQTILGNDSQAREIADYLNKAQILFSDNTIILAWGIVAFIVILLIFTNLGYLGSFLRSCGFPAFIVGGLFFLLAYAVNPILSLVKIPEQFADTVNFVVGFLVAMLKDLSLSVLAVGFVLILISFITDAIGRKIRKEE